MKGSEISDKTMQTLREFDMLDTIQPTEGWSESVMKRLATTTKGKRHGASVPGVAWVLLVFILANMGLLFTALGVNSRHSGGRSSDLRTLSGEFLVNPTSISE